MFFILIMFSKSSTLLNVQNTEQKTVLKGNVENCEMPTYWCLGLIMFTLVLTTYLAICWSPLYLSIIVVRTFSCTINVHHTQNRTEQNRTEQNRTERKKTDRHVLHVLPSVHACRSDLVCSVYDVPSACPYACVSACASACPVCCSVCLCLCLCLLLVLFVCLISMPTPPTPVLLPEV